MEHVNSQQAREKGMKQVPRSIIGTYFSLTLEMNFDTVKILQIHEARSIYHYDYTVH
jgi:hypothetical protein